MPRYTYTCEKCYWEGTRVAKFEERDKLTCEQPIYQTEIEAGADIVPCNRKCGGKLVRAELETTSFTPHFWQP
jgi:hypothetical protein